MEKKHECKKCGQKFFTERRLKRHDLEVHRRGLGGR